MELLGWTSRAIYFLTHWAVMRPRFIYISNKQHRTQKRRSVCARIASPKSQQSDAAFKRLSTSCFLFYGSIVLFLWRTVPLNHVLLIPSEHNPSLHPPAAARLVKMFCCWTLWPSPLPTWDLFSAQLPELQFFCASLVFSLHLCPSLLSVFSWDFLLSSSFPFPSSLVCF